MGVSFLRDRGPTDRFLTDRVYQPRHAAPPGLFWRSLVGRRAVPGFTLSGLPSDSADRPRLPSSAGIASSTQDQGDGR